MINENLNEYLYLFDHFIYTYQLIDNLTISHIILVQ